MSTPNEQNVKPKLLILVQHYLPGYKAGGPIRSITNLVEHLQPDFDMTLITSDRDFGDSSPFKGVELNALVDGPQTKTVYLSPSYQGPWTLYRFIKYIDPDCIYVNSLFSPRFSIALMTLKRIGLLRNKPVVLAPRGELGAGALSIKRRKKQHFLKIAKITNLYQEVTWHASSEGEAQDIRLMFGNQAHVVRADNLAAPMDQQPQWPVKQIGMLKLVFLSRISRKKQLDLALQALAYTRKPIQFDIYGPLEDHHYWQECSRIIKQLPESVNVAYQGTLPPEQARERLCHYEAFVLPTLNENYGHVIFEALAAGCPPIISPYTPWGGVIQQNSAGWVTPLSAHKLALNLEQVASLSDAELKAKRLACRHTAQSHLNNQDQQLAIYRSLFGLTRFRAKALIDR